MNTEGAHHILVVEDDKFYREAFVKMLQEHGYDVDAADDGKVGLEMLKEKHYDLIISDIMHPHLDGLQMVERFNTLASVQEQGPIWYLSNLADHKDVIKQAYDLGVKKILSKSVVSPEEALVMIDEYFEKARGDDDAKRKELLQELLGAEDSLPYMLQFDHVKTLPNKKYLFIITDEQQRGKYVSAYLDHRVDITNSLDEGIEMMNPEKYKLVYADQKVPERNGFHFWIERDGISLYESDEYKKARESSVAPPAAAGEPATKKTEPESAFRMLLRFLGFK